MCFFDARADPFRDAIIREATFRGANKLHLPPPCEATAAAGDFCFRHFWRFFWGLRGKGPFGGGEEGPIARSKFSIYATKINFSLGGGGCDLPVYSSGCPREGPNSEIVRRKLTTFFDQAERPRTKTPLAGVFVRRDIAKKQPGFFIAAWIRRTRLPKSGGPDQRETE